MASAVITSEMYDTIEKASRNEMAPDNYNVELTDLLRNKMTSSLKAMNTYSTKDMAVVSRLVQENVISLHFVGSEALWQLLKDSRMSDEISQFLEDQKSKLSHINTNELVLFLTFGGSPKNFANGSVSRPEIGESNWQSIVDQTKSIILRALAATSGFKPVRILVAGEWDLSLDLQSSSERSNTLRMTFLNVVNTDIGGPSMIQLLDHAHNDLKWTNAVALIEAWRDGEMLWSDHRLWMAPTDANGSYDEMSSDGFGGTPEPYPMSDVVEVTINEQSTDELIETIPDDSQEIRQQEDSTEEEDKYEASKSSPRRLQPGYEAIMASKPNIAHPTWEHGEHAGSLLDLVRMQASQIPTGSSNSDIAESEAVGSTNPDKTTNATSEDSFEMV